MFKKKQSQSWNAVRWNVTQLGIIHEKKCVTSFILTSQCWIVLWKGNIKSKLMPFCHKIITRHFRNVNYIWIISSWNYFYFLSFIKAQTIMYLSRLNNEKLYPFLNKAYNLITNIKYTKYSKRSEKMKTM